MNKKKIHACLRTLGRHALPKNWHEHCEVSRHAPANYRRHRVRIARRRENQNLVNHFYKIEEYEPLCVAKRDADWLYF